MNCNTIAMNHVIFNTMTINIEKSLSGWLVLSTMHKGQRVTRKYCGYSLKQAKVKFKNELK